MIRIRELWKPITGYDGAYSISNHGRIKSYRNGKWGLRAFGKLLPNTPDSYGYPLAKLSKDGKVFSTHVSRIVLSHFVGPAPKDKPYALHKDSNPLNSAPDNLYWGDQFDNMADRKLNGTSNHGERNGQAILTEEKVLSIRRQLAYGAKQTDLAKEYGITQGAISRIEQRKAWRHI